MEQHRSTVLKKLRSHCAESMKRVDVPEAKQEGGPFRHTPVPAVTPRLSGFLGGPRKSGEVLGGPRS